MTTPADPPTEPARAPSDWGRLLVLVLLAVGLRAWTIPNTTVPSRDCIVFVRDGLQLENPPPQFEGSRLKVLRKVEHPPGYPAAIIVMSWLVRPVAGTTVESMALSAQLVSGLSAVLLVFPMFLLTRRLFDRNTAFAAVAVFQVLPVFVEVTSDGISDGLFLLTAAWALWFGVRALEQDGRRAAALYGLAAGACCGIGYLLRPDSMVVATAIGLTFAGVVVRRLRGGGWFPPFVAGLGLVIGTFAIVGPYAVTIGKLTNKITAQGFFQGEFDKGFFDRNRDQSVRPGVRLPLAAWYHPIEDADEWKPWWAVKALWREYTKAAHYAVPGFAFIGLIALRRRLTDPRVALLVMTGLVHLTILWILAWKVDYVSQRHTLLTVMVSCVFAAAALPIIGAWLVRQWRWRRPAEPADPQAADYREPETDTRSWVHRRTPWEVGAALAVLLMASALPRDFRSLHIERAGHKAAGKWIKEHGEADIPVVDPFGWAEWYAERSLRYRTAPDVTKGEFLYAVYEPNAKSAHSRLFLYTSAGLLAKPENMVYKYPEDAPPEKIKVAVYKSPPLKKAPE